MKIKAEKQLEDKSKVEEKEYDDEKIEEDEEDEDENEDQLLAKEGLEIEPESMAEGHEDKKPERRKKPKSVVSQVHECALRMKMNVEFEVNFHPNHWNIGKPSEYRFDSNLNLYSHRLQIHTQNRPMYRCNGFICSQALGEAACPGGRS